MTFVLPTHLGNCDIHVRQKISVMNEMKRYKIWPRPKVWVQKIFRILPPNFIKGLNKISRKIFEPLGFTSRIQLIKLGSTPFKDGTKTSRSTFLLEKRLHPFLYWIPYSWSGLTHILYSINLLVRWNTLHRNQISSCQYVFYYKKLA
jgi:hypothetical protein